MQSKQIERFIKSVHRKFNLNPQVEKKGCSFSDGDAAAISKDFVSHLSKFPDFRFGTITICKRNVVDRLRKDQNIIYNFATYQLLHALISKFELLHFVPDKRSIKINRGMMMSDYLTTKLVTEHGSSIEILYDPQVSLHYKDLWLADWIANFVWRHYEDNRSEAFNILRSSPQYFHKELYF